MAPKAAQKYSKTLLEGSKCRQRLPCLPFLGFQPFLGSRQPLETFILTKKKFSLFEPTMAPLDAEKNSKTHFSMIRKLPGDPFHHFLELENPPGLSQSDRRILDHTKNQIFITSNKNGTKSSRKIF